MNHKSILKTEAEKGGDSSKEKPKKRQESFIDQVNKAIIESINVRSVKTRFNNAKNHRQSHWDSKWQMIQDALYPNMGDYSSADKGFNRNAGSTSKYKSYTSAASSRVHSAVATLNASTADPSVQWMDLNFFDPCFLLNGMPLYLNDIDPACRWLERNKQAAYWLFASPESGFYTSNYSLQFNWMSLGTGCREIIRRKDTGNICFNTVPLQEIYIEAGSYGDIEVVYRLLKKTPLQAFELWGKNISPNKLDKAMKEDAGETLATDDYLEVTQPNPLRKTEIGMILPEIITYVIEMDTNKIVDLSLHHYSPYVVSRFDVAPGEIYGRSFVWLAMPDIRLLNKLNDDAMLSAAFSARPVMLAQDIGSINWSQFIPGGVIQGLDIDKRPTLQPMQSMQGFPFLMDLIKYKMLELDEALFSVEMLPRETSNMTATEANLHKLQSMNRLRPMLVRLEHEDLSKTVIKTLSLLQEAGKIDPFPYGEVEEFLRNKGMDWQQGWLQKLMPFPLKQINVSFSGAMARMQRMQDLYNVDMLLQKTATAAQFNGSVVDYIDLDQVVKVSADILGTTLKVVRSDKVVDQIRQTRQAAVQAEEAQRQEIYELQKQKAIIDNTPKALGMTE